MGKKRWHIYKKGWCTGVLSILLALSVAMGGFTVYAADTEGTTGFIEEITYINPLYADVIYPSDLEQSENGSIMLLRTSYRQCASMKEAAEYVRSQMKKRVGTFSFQMTFEGSAPADFLTTILDQAMEHTGKSTEGDYLRWQYGGVRLSGSYYSTGNKIFQYTWTFTVTYYTTELQETEMDTLVKKVLDSLELEKASEYEKAEGIYRYICSNVKYDYANLNNTSYHLKFTAYAALKNKTAVCQGYALLFYRLALELGLDARFISGISNGGAHGWNIVKVDGRYYNLDATWDAEYYKVLGKYEYFLKSNSNFKDHIRDNSYKTAKFNAAYLMSGQNYTVPRSISSATVTVGTTSCVYTGSEMKPSVTVKLSGTTLKKDTDYKVFYSDNVNVGTATITVEGKGKYTGTVKKTFRIILKKGGTYTVGGLKYKVTNASTNGKGTVAVIGTTNKNLTSLKLGSIKIGGISLKITEIGKNAFKGRTKLKTVKMGSGIKSIGASAFRGCTKLNSLTIGSGVTTIGDKAFYKCSALKKLEIPGKVQSIGKSAFYGCTKMSSLTINTTKLTNSSVGSNAFKKMNAKVKIKVPKSKKSLYKKLLKSKGISSRVSIS